ncbi:putative transcriptional regulator YheO [Mesorhizobium soli]|uniref:helix-turn-helix transcriptional regulator n=1 Tax=Pseudaminobacter soli (ex Li et al. 2025) TaxID=1295366 RepID=UPI0024742FB0|nr:PAS domain-containing protein [Mesorhizobium soli]MDH6231774.1 putative transcriptional regulator YheO [Mesorhizobium soli]
MTHELDKYLPVAEAVAALLRPHAEVVIHDLETGNIRHIVNPLSRRQAGASSMTEMEVASSLEASVIGPYRKTNWDRRQLRSVTAVLRNDAGHPVGLLCINLDISAFEGAVAFIRRLIEFSPAPVLHSDLFKPEWKETASTILSAYLASNKLTEAAMSRDDHLAVLRLLDEAGIFDMRGAMPHVTQMLRLSRSTVYNMLNEIRKNP